MSVHYQPLWGRAEEANLQDLFRRLQLSMFSGHYVTEAERMLCGAFADSQALVVNSGTAAIHTALACLGVGPGDEVVVPAVSYPATALAPIYVGAEPVFADIRSDTWTLDAESCGRVLSSKTRAVIFVNLFGTSGNLVEVWQWCRQHDIRLIQDAAQSLGTLVDGHLLGLEGDAACFSFFETKTASVGEGGAVLLRNSVPLEVGRRLRHHGMDDAAGSRLVSSVGFNYKMAELQAACLVAQLSKLPTIAARRHAHGTIVRAALKPSAILQSTPSGEETCWDKVGFLLSDETQRERTEYFYHRLGLRRYLSRPLSDEPVFSECRRDGDLPVACDFCRRHLIWQCSPVFDTERVRVAAQQVGDALQTRGDI